MSKDKGKLYEETLKAFKAGLMAETGGTGSYSIINNSGEKPTKAAGRYQFVPSHWKDKVSSFAKKKGMSYESWDKSFVGNAELQEEFFEDYYSKTVWPEIKKAKDSGALKKAEISMDEYAYAIHFDGVGGGKKFLDPNYVRPADKHGNPKSTKVFDNYRKYREKFGAKPYYGYSDEEIKKEYDYFNKQNKEIDASDASDELKAIKKTKLQKQIQKNGLLPEFNKIIVSENNALNAKNESKTKEIAEDLKMLNRFKLLYNEDENKKLNITSASYTPWSANDKVEKAEFENWKKRNPQYFKKGTNFYNEINLDAIYKLQDKIKDSTGQDVELLKKSGYKNIKGKDLDLDVSKLSVVGVGLSNLLGEKGSYSANPAVEKQFTAVTDPKLLKNLLVEIPYDENDDLEEEQLGEDENGTGTPNGGTGDGSASVNADGSPNIGDNPNKQSVPVKEYATTYFDREMDVKTPDGDAPYKNDFPYADVLGGAVGAIAGINMAKTKIPMRDEQVSDAFRNYAAELSKLSQIGLRPEDEAYAKRMLAESYQGSVEAMVNASGGNRNSVLGNMGTINAQKQKGLMEIALADGAAKTAALHKYGEAMKYISEFDATRDIANNERKYANAIQTKQAGAQLASNSFNAMLDSIDTYKANAPGSANHMYKSYMYKQVLGFDPQIKDDGTGNIPNSYSAFKKEQEKNAERAVEYNAYRDKFFKMDEKQQLQITKFMGQNLNTKDAYKFIDYVSENNPEGDLNFDNYSEAMKEGSFNKLFEESQTSFVPEEVKSEVTQDALALPAVEQVAEQAKAPELLAPKSNEEMINQFQTNSGAPTQNFPLTSKQADTSAVAPMLDGSPKLDLGQSDTPKVYGNGIDEIGEKTRLAIEESKKSVAMMNSSIDKSNERVQAESKLSAYELEQEKKRAELQRQQALITGNI